MSAEFNNGLILGLSLQGGLFVGGSFNDVEITEIKSNHTQLRIKYNKDTEWTIFNRTEDIENDIITLFCVKNGATLILTPMNEADIVYQQVEA